MNVTSCHHCDRFANRVGFNGKGEPIYKCGSGHVFTDLTGVMPPAQGLARRTDPATSHIAAASVDVTKLERQVLDALGKMRWIDSGGTSTEIAQLAGMDKWSVSPRMKPLEDKGLVRRTDVRRNNQIVWRLADDERE